LPEERIRFLTGYSQGILGRAYDLMNDKDFWQLRKNVADEIREILSRRNNPLQLSESWHPQAERILSVVEFWLRDMLLLQAQPGSELVNGDYMVDLAECTACCPIQKTVILLEECALARQRLAARCNAQLVFDSLVLKMWEV